MVGLDRGLKIHNDISMTYEFAILFRVAHHFVTIQNKTANSGLGSANCNGPRLVQLLFNPVLRKSDQCLWAGLPPSKGQLRRTQLSFVRAQELVHMNKADRNELGQSSLRRISLDCMDVL